MPFPTSSAGVRELAERIVARGNQQSLNLQEGARVELEHHVRAAEALQRVVPENLSRRLRSDANPVFLEEFLYNRRVRLYRDFSTNPEQIFIPPHNMQRGGPETAVTKIQAFNSIRQFIVSCVIKFWES
jgi:hypothetical protein